MPSNQLSHLFCVLPSLFFLKKYTPTPRRTHLTVQKVDFYFQIP